ncbi:GOLPH3/VPS74 family protein [Actinomycetota bacterium Odt1-20B]
MPYGSLSLPARLYLLAANPAKGRVSASMDLDVVVRACALAELAQRGFIAEVNGIVTPVLGARTGDPVLDELMELIEESRPKGWRPWMTHRSRATLEAVRDGLVAGGYLRVVRVKRLGVFPGRRHELERAGYVELLQGEALAVLRRSEGGSEGVDAVPVDDAALVVIASTGAIRTLVRGLDHWRYKERLEELAARAGAERAGLPEALANLRKALKRALAARSAARDSGGGGGG